MIVINSTVSRNAVFNSTSVIELGLPKHKQATAKHKQATKKQQQQKSKKKTQQQIKQNKNRTNQIYVQHKCRKQNNKDRK